MLSFKLAALVAATLISINGVSSQLNANPTIPNHLVECYRNNSIYYRGNRLPSNLRSLIDLIRKVESSPTGRNMNAREMSLALTYYLRLDGIVVTPTVQQTEDVIPFAPGGDEYYKHRLTLVGLLPKANQPSSYAFFNESLTTEELCNLHFMLSYSIDAYKRDDEQCSTNNVETNNPAYPSYANNNNNNNNNNNRNNRRWRRSAKKDEETPKIGSYDADRLEKKGRHAKHLKKDNKTEKLKKKWESRHRRYVSLDGSEEEQDKNTEVEAIPPQELQNQNNDERNQDFKIGNQDLLGVGGDHIMRGGMQDGQDEDRWGTKPRPIPRPYPPRPIPDRQKTNFRSQLDKRTAPNVGLSSKSVIPNVQFSECPIENGVVYTNFGSVTMGTVVAGIAAGLNRQYIDPTQLNVDPNDIKPELKGVKVDNVWATTMAGNTADMILSLGIISDINQAVGLRGGWNDTFNPKWYLLQTKDIKYLTDVELRGAMDGLWLGKVVAGWIQKVNTLKLSQVLDMYYSQVGSIFDPNVQACKRRENFVQFAPDDEFTQQVHIFCQVMNKQRINTVTFQDFSVFTQNTVSNIKSYAPQMDSSCSTRSSSLGNVLSSASIDSNNNLIMVVDAQWEYDYVVNFIRYLANAEIAATPYQSNLTILCGKDGNILATVSDSVALQTNFTREKYRTCTSGFDIGAIYSQLENIYRKIYYIEKNGVSINTLSQITLFLPFSQLQNSSDYTTKRQTFNESFPDVRFLVATTASRETFSSLVNDPSKDIFTVRLPIDSSSVEGVQQLIRRINTTPQRLAKTQCGSYYTYEEGTSSVVDNIRLGYTKFYRLHPNYFYSADSPKVSIKSIRSAPLTVCYSRTNEQPTADGSQYTPDSSTNSYNQQFPVSTTPQNQLNNNYYFRQFARQNDLPTTGQNCKTITGETFDIQLEDPCDDADSISDCAPVYISIYAPRPDANSLSFTCLTCRLPTNVEYQIVFENGSCDSGVGTLIFSPIIALVSIILIYLSNKSF